MLPVKVRSVVPDFVKNRDRRYDTYNERNREISK